MAQRGPPRLSAACRSGRQAAGVPLASSEASAAGSERPTACARSQGAAERRAHPPGACRAGRELRERHVYGGRGHARRGLVGSVWELGLV